MTSQQFTDLQNALVYVFWPIMYIWLACFGAGGMMLAIWNIWLGLLRWISKRRY